MHELYFTRQDENIHGINFSYLAQDVNDISKF